VLAAACLFSACEGGQTGQPGVGSNAACDSPWVPVPADQGVASISPRQLAQACVGHYTAPLLWSAAADGPDSGVATDEIRVDISYAGADGSANECAMRVEVTVEITTRDSGVHETGTALLQAPLGALLPASFDLSGRDVDASVELRVEAGQVVISGGLQSRTSSTPSTSAQFSAAQQGGAGAGGADGSP
jgi:hypothetical protein